MTSPADPGFGIYLHWPFCSAKCPYCDFNSHVRHGGVDQARYGRAFARELATLRQRTGPREVTSVFLGGGTPSLMEAGTVGALLDAVARHWHIADGAEITLEANPGSADSTRFQGYRAAGVNRLSLGVQSLRDDELRFLGRLHDVGEALRAIELARSTFPRLSFDLIYARPGPEAAGLEGRTSAGHRPRRRPSFLYQLTIEHGAVPCTLRAGRLVRRIRKRRQNCSRLPRVTSLPGCPAYRFPTMRCQARKPQPRLLALWRICRRWPRRMAASSKMAGASSPSPSAHRNLAGTRRVSSAWHYRWRNSQPRRGSRRTAADGPPSPWKAWTLPGTKRLLAGR